MAEAEAYLTELAALLIARGFTVDTAVVYDGAAAAILDEAKGREVDLIVMATHGRGGFGRLRYGSVAEAVLRRAEARCCWCTPRVSKRPHRLACLRACPSRSPVRRSREKPCWSPPNWR